jgi:DTW domain-containing protein YfiP
VLPRIETATKIVLLQHPRERDMPIGTARMANLCLPNSELNVGVGWEGSAVLGRAISDPSHPPVLLYPTDPRHETPPRPVTGPVTLIVVDGTWSQARKVVRLNPTLARLPRLGFRPEVPSEYRIRREPREECVSTIEALMLALGELESEPERFRALLVPFRMMIDRQIRLREQHRGSECRHVKNKISLASRIPEVFRARATDLVCVVGEANAWPLRAEAERTNYPDELIHWVACRPATGDVFDAIIAPRYPLAPKTAAHVRLSPQQLAGGRTLEDVLAQWREFKRDSDVVCSWGSYSLNLFTSTGGALPSMRLDLRSAIKDIVKRNIGTLEEFVSVLDPEEQTAVAQGRAGARVSLLSRVALDLSRGSMAFTESALKRREPEP